MKIPVSWLLTYLEKPLSTEKISEALTLAGIEVEKIELSSLSFTNVVVGAVLHAEPHPQADNLQIATVFDGKEKFQVVCGAKNCREGLIVAFAKIGATLHDENQKKFTIKKTKIRGIESDGMLCAGKELGLTRENDAILELPKDTPIGIDLSELYQDPILDISLTPNLGHCMSVIGIAREISALCEIPIRLPKVKVIENSSEKTKDLIEIEVKDSKAAPRYSCRISKNIKVGPSPDWLKKALISSGHSSINNIVDVANYVMLETGQPLHIFDYDKISGKKIQVSTKSPHKTFIGLDNIEREIPSGTLLINDAEKPIALAGILGSLDSSITDSTKNILIESACFDPIIIRKMSKTFHLRTDAAQRFEKGIDFEKVLFALDRASALIEQVAGGQICQGYIDKKENVSISKKILCRTAHVNKILGTQLATGEISSILKRLEIEIHDEKNMQLTAEPPTYRNDLKTEIDLIEEIARVYGYNNIPKKIPRHVSSTITNAPMYEFENLFRQKLLQEGLQECMTCDLISPFLANIASEKTLGETNLVHVLHPRSTDQSVLRTSLLPGFLQLIQHNISHQNHDIHGFEIGRIHFKDKDNFTEQSVMGIALKGHTAPYHFSPKPRKVDFFDLKGVVENLFLSCGLKEIEFEPSHLENFHPFRQAKIKHKEITIGVMGEIHPAHCHTMQIEDRIYFAEINLNALLSIVPSHAEYNKIPSFPGSERDWTITLQSNVPLSQIFQEIQKFSCHYLEKVTLLDIYTSKELGKDKKNVTIRFFYRDPQKTISFETVEAEHNKILTFLSEKISLLNKSSNVT